MITLPIVDDQPDPSDVVELELRDFPGVTVIARRPDRALFADGFTHTAATLLVQLHIVSIKGLQMTDEEIWTTEPYDHSNPRHFRSLSLELTEAIYDALLTLEPDEPPNEQSN